MILQKLYIDNLLSKDFVLLISLILVVSSSLIGQHTLTLNMSNDNPTEINFKHSSNMALGCFSPNNILLNDIKPNEDGKISFEIISLEGENEKLNVSLIGDASNPVVYTFVLENRELRIMETIDGIDELFPVRVNGVNYVYKEGDELIIYRCKNSILYLINGKIARVTKLQTTDFSMAGDIKVISTSSAELNANVSFNL